MKPDLTKPDLTISLVQSALVWEDPQANRNYFEKCIVEAGSTDLIILPETFTTGFSMHPDRLAEPQSGPTELWMLKMAASSGAVITGSVISELNGQYYNRLIWATPAGNSNYYNKRHLFTMGGEDKVFAAGKEQTIFELKSWNICPQICYDLRFPTWSRNTSNYDLLFYVANWPEKRAHHWSALLRARAIENLSWVAAVNRVGEDGNGTSHSGDSTVIDPVGTIVFEEKGKALVKTITLDGRLVAASRQKFAFLDDQDKFEIQL